MSGTLPKGQHPRPDFPRFGLTQFAYRFPRETGVIRLRISGDAIDGFDID